MDRSALITMQHGSAYTIIRATSYTYGEGQNWGYQNSETYEPIVTKFGMGHYVGDLTQQAKIHTDRPSGGVPANGWNITFAWFLILKNSLGQPPCTGSSRVLNDMNCICKRLLNSVSH